MGPCVTAIIEASGRHVHLSHKDAYALFGEGFELLVRHKLGESEEFLSDSKVTLIGPGEKELSASVLGPYRAETQIELSYTEARLLGIRPPLGDSGRLEGTMGIKVAGPKGEIQLSRGVMVARRHVHMPPADAEALGVQDRDMVVLQVDGPRKMIFQNLLVRVAPVDMETTYSDVHLDYDEWNAAGLEGTSAHGKIYRSILDISE